MAFRLQRNGTFTDHSWVAGGHEALGVLVTLV